MKPVLARRRHAARLDRAGLTRILPQIQALIEASRQHVVSTVNLALVWLNWNVGRIISEEMQRHAERANYGEGLLEALGQRLTKHYGTGYSARSLWDMRRFFTDFRILPPAVAELGDQKALPPPVAESSPDPSAQPVARQCSPDRITIDFSKHSHQVRKVARSSEDRSSAPARISIGPIQTIGCFAGRCYSLILPDHGTIGPSALGLIQQSPQVLGKIRQIGSAHHPSGSLNLNHLHQQHTITP